MERLNPRIYLDLDPAMTAASDQRVPSQRAVKSYIDGQYLHAAATLTFGSIGSNSTSTQTISVPGATAGSAVALGVPSTINAGLIWCGYVSSADTVTVRLHNTSGGSIDPVDLEWHVKVEAH